MHQHYNIHIICFTIWCSIVTKPNDFVTYHGVRTHHLNGRTLNGVEEIGQSHSSRTDSFYCCWIGIIMSLVSYRYSIKYYTNIWHGEVKEITLQHLLSIQLVCCFYSSWTIYSFVFIRLIHTKIRRFAPENCQYSSSSHNQ